MPDITGIVAAFISAVALTSVAFINGWVGKKKNEADANASDAKRLIDECKYLREELNTVRQEKIKLEAENAVLTRRLLSERDDCQNQINELKRELEKLRETVSKQSVEIERLKSK